MEGNGHGQLWRTANLIFAWTVCGKLHKTSLMIISVLSKILTDHLLNTRLKCYSLSQRVSVYKHLQVSKPRPVHHSYSRSETNTFII
jgi:hypothetical protein